MEQDPRAMGVRSVRLQGDLDLVYGLASRRSVRDGAADELTLDAAAVTAEEARRQGRQDSSPCKSSRSPQICIHQEPFRHGERECNKRSGPQEELTQTVAQAFDKVYYDLLLVEVSWPRFDEAYLQNLQICTKANVKELRNPQMYVRLRDLGRRCA
jgi:hypothetical protein